ncbi:uncharacterized protein E6C27_scaffold345G00060 [Cucumis melo var. makuwa]|uniref:Uncharacterized protein n=1 Tax=Cucumis melo var. makuwa TaxID=1194695 RepID=A0A5A7THT6_CUCMM|nr:uncharacterized protein E6C27_scaffold345G00060 [Cucumis melo var. makuwa]
MASQMALRVRGAPDATNDSWKWPREGSSRIACKETLLEGAPIEQEEETEKGRFKDEMSRNIGVDIDEDTTNIFQDLLNEAHNEFMLLELLRAAFPMCSTTIPSSFYEAKRKLRERSLLWRGSIQGSADMIWHRDKRVKTDDVLRNPADVEGWKHFDSEFLDFASDPWNVHLGLASYEFNSFGQMSTLYSIWPLVLLLYNLLPWKCMTETNFFMSLLIPGPKSHGREINVYLQPLIEELKELWTFGVCMYESLIVQFFQLHAALLWTINDFQAYGDLS